MEAKDQALDVWGEFACFTRPELKVERFSYPVPTPSAVRGIYDAVYCKRTAFRWQVTSVEILKPVRYAALRRNEVQSKVGVDSVVEKWRLGKGTPWLCADGEDERTQRQTMALRDVRYRLHAKVVAWDPCANLAEIEGQFRRRAEHGKCIYQPYFGCREFPAYFELVPVPPEPTQPELFDQDIGWMLYDVFDLSRPHDPLDTSLKGNPDGTLCISLFEAKVKGGVLDIPSFDDDRVKKVPEVPRA